MNETPLVRELIPLISLVLEIDKTDHPVVDAFDFRTSEIAETSTTNSHRKRRKERGFIGNILHNEQRKRRTKENEKLC